MLIRLGWWLRRLDLSELEAQPLDFGMRAIKLITKLCNASTLGRLGALLTAPALHLLSARDRRVVHIDNLTELMGGETVGSVAETRDVCQHRVGAVGAVDATKQPLGPTVDYPESFPIWVLLIDPPQHVCSVVNQE